MAGTLFIVCIPTGDKEEILRNNSPKLFINRELEQFVLQTQKEGTANEAICLDIEQDEHITASNESFHKIKALSKTKSCDDIVRDVNHLHVDDTKLKSRQSLDETRTRSCEKAKKKSRIHNEPQLHIPIESSMELVLTKILQLFRIDNAAWNQNNDMYSVTFSLSSGGQHDQILKLFKHWGIGERPGSSVAMLPCTVILPTKSNEKVEDEVFSEELFAKDSGMWDGFVNSVNARMNVAKIVDELRQNAALTFDFVVLIVIAGIMAAFGLIENSIICLTSSMLISPLMGPLIAATFSTVIKDRKLMKFGVINGLVGLFLATLVGFLFGLIVGSVDERYGVGDGLGQEILSRCEIHSLVIGAFTAIPSGAAVAIAILGENIASLVGVAISASLLPPAVNAGLLWALALLFMVHRDNEKIYNSVIKSTMYSENQAVELAILGTISMAVTVINVICIYGAGILFLKIKEVAPMVSKNQQQFWKHDVKVARDYNKTLGAGEGVSLKEKVLEDLAEIQGNNIRTLNSERYSNQHTWSPMMRTGARTSRMPIQELEKLYSNQTDNKAARRLNRVGVLGKSMSMSPPQYQPLRNDMGNNEFQFPNSLRNSGLSSSSQCASQQILSKSKNNSEPNDIARTSNREAIQRQTKSKFIVTRAVDPLKFDEN
ncbi:uncharacterized protein LOC119085886 [Bradysia coprophila]|uniref:uncharacterized protein LOC119085886 n=1 Tax=Bradysia coprophila TaxID=38358 RepID=UPI00187D940D|nr:uncharacterized protein LOC119085886 [Bradysia coprophila]